MTIAIHNAQTPGIGKKAPPLKGLRQMLRRIPSFLILGSTVLLLASSGNSQELKVEVLDNPPRKLASSASGCGNSSAQKIIVEVPAPEIIILRAGGISAPEPTSFLQRCNHWRTHQWTHTVARGHGSASVSGIPHSFAPQSFAPQSFAPQSFAPQSFMPQSFAPQSFAPQSFFPQSFAPQSFVPQSFVPQSFVPQSFVPQSFVPQSFAPQSFAPQAGTADDRVDIRTAVKSLSENMEAASKLLKAQAQILKVHDDKIGDIETILKDSKQLLDAVKGKTVTRDPVDGTLRAK